MARDSMVSLILYLRTKVNDVESLIWTDDQLQVYLDMHRVHLIKELLINDVNYLSYYASVGLLESDVSLWDSNGSGAVEIPNSGYTSNLIDGIFTFSTAQSSELYLDAKSYNIHGAIAECLEQLAMDPNRAKTWSRGSVSYTHYDLMEMAKYHRNQTGIQNISIIRTYRGIQTDYAKI